MKKFILLLMFFSFGVLLTGCSLLSSIKAVKGFSEDYNIYTPIYQNATFYTVSTDTSVNVIDTNVEGLTSFSDSINFVIDKTNSLTYIEQNLDGNQTASLFQKLPLLTIEYVIDGNTILPTIPTSEESVNTNIFNSDNSFSLNDISNENVTGDHQYEFDIFLTQVVDLDKLTTLAEQFSIFEEGLSVFDNALAHVTVQFTEEESMIDINASLTEYQIAFDDGNYATISITNHTVMTIPSDPQIFDVFSNDYTFIAVDDIRLATKVYPSDSQIQLPVVEGENGWIQLYLEAGTYNIESSNFGVISSSYLVNGSMELIEYNAVNSIQVTIPESGNYYFYIIPSVSTEIDLSFVTMP
ncbi:MAG: hypothetical protein AB7U79_07665 [Candidatus Izemoplasmatales bacterium]